MAKKPYASFAGTVTLHFGSTRYLTMHLPTGWRADQYANKTPGKVQIINLVKIVDKKGEVRASIKGASVSPTKSNCPAEA